MAWLGVRVDVLGAILCCGVSLLAVLFQAFDPSTPLHLTHTPLTPPSPMGGLRRSGLGRARLTLRYLDDPHHEGNH